MTELETLRHDNAAMKQLIEELSRRATDAEASVAAIARNEVDSVTLAAGLATPTLLHAAQDHLRSSQQLLRAIFDSALDAIMLADDSGACIDANPAACSMFQLAHEAIVGRNLAELIVTRPEGETELDELRSRGRMFGQFTLQRLEGSPRIVDYSTVANVSPGLHLWVLRDITDRVSTEQSLHRNERLFRAVIEKSAEVISLTSIDGTTRYLTPAVWRMLGWSEGDAGLPTLRDQVVPEDRERLEAELARLVRSGDRDLSIDLRVRHRDGSMRWIESTGTNLLDDPDVRAIVGNYRDITPRKQAEEALRASLQTLEESQAIAHVGSWTSELAADGALEWSRETYRIFGVPDGTAMTVASFLACVHVDDRPRMETATRSAIESGAPIEVEHRVQRPDGRPCWVRECGFVERDPSGAPIRMFGTVQDITHHYIAAEALRVSEQRYRRIVEGTNDGVWMYDVHAVTTFMNRRMAEMLGCTVAEAVGQPVFAFMQESDVPGAHERTQRRMRGVAERSDYHLRRRDGSQLWVSIQATPLFDLDGKFEAALCLITDVSGQRSADESRAHLASIVESSEDAIISTRLDGTITSWNLGAELLYQYSATEITGTSMFVLIPADAVDAEHESLRRVARGERVRQYDTVRLRKDGTTVEVAVTISPVRGAAGAVIGMSKIARDLTPRRLAEASHRKVEAQFRQAQKMEAVGRLAGGVAHDFNNLLTVILSYTELAIDDLKAGDPMRADMHEIKRAAERASELTKQLLAFSRQQVLRPRVVDLGQIVSGMQVMLRRLLGEDVVLGLAAIDHGRILADPGQIEQVVMNLAVNARDAMPDGGTLSIETADIRFEVESVDGLSVIPVGSYVRLTVSDTGSGMDDATRTRIFEPFFTTKPQGKGTGLGLSTVFGIVQQSGGFLAVHSELSKGTSFNVYFPRTELIDDARTSVPLVVMQGSETILLVEDEEQVRNVACATLRRAGYCVLDTSNAGEAFLVSKDCESTIHLLLTDVVMPRVSGRRLAEQLAEQRPEMKVLFTSGYTNDAIVHHRLIDAGPSFLQKPFTPNALLRRVREVLDETI